jgi:L-lactate dehydrogenase complex protein LldE
VAERSGDPALVGAVAETAPRTYELTEFLVDVLGVTDVGAYFPHRVTYHPTCHSLRMLGVGDRPRQLLEQVRGIELVELPNATECCGFGGTFALKNADTSVAMGADKARHVRDTGAEVLVAGDNSCLMHIGGMLSRQRAGVRVMHLAEVLAATEDDEAESSGPAVGARAEGAR